MTTKIYMLREQDSNLPPIFFTTLANAKKTIENTYSNSEVFAQPIHWTKCFGETLLGVIYTREGAQDARFVIEAHEVLERDDHL